MQDFTFFFFEKIIQKYFYLNTFKYILCSTCLTSDYQLTHTHIFVLSTLHNETTTLLYDTVQFVSTFVDILMLLL